MPARAASDIRRATGKANTDGVSGAEPGFKAFIQQVFSAQPFTMALGARLGRIDAGSVELILSIRPDHLQHGGAVHGGAIGAMAPANDAEVGRFRDATIDGGEMTLWVKLRRRVISASPQLYP
jgi:hypothetical protein